MWQSWRPCNGRLRLSRVHTGFEDAERRQVGRVDDLRVDAAAAGLAERLRGLVRQCRGLALVGERGVEPPQPGRLLPDCLGQVLQGVVELLERDADAGAGVE